MEELSENTQSSGDTRMNVGHRKSNLTSIGREVMIDDIAGMILKCKKRKNIMNVIVRKYGYSPTTAKDIFTEANKYIAKNFSQDEVKIAARKVNDLYERTIEEKETHVRWKLIAADQMSKLFGHYKPDTMIQINNLNGELYDKMKDYTIEELEEINKILKKDGEK